MLNLRCRFSARRRPQNRFLAVHTSAGLEDGVSMVLNRDCRDDEGEKCKRLPYEQARVAVWRCQKGEEHDSSTCLAENFEFVVVNS